MIKKIIFRFYEGEKNTKVSLTNLDFILKTLIRLEKIICKSTARLNKMIKNPILFNSHLLN